MARRLSPERRLNKIRDLIEEIDHRAMEEDGPVRPTRLVMTDAEMRTIYTLAVGPA